MHRTTVVWWLLTGACCSAFARDLIYHSEKPDLINVWNRVADFSEVLRSVEAAELSPDGRLAVSGSKFGYRVMLWRVVDGTLLWENTHESEVECVCFSPDGKRIASGGEDFFVRIWDTQSGRQLHAWEHDNGLDGITWSHDGNIIASGSEGGEAYLWDATSYQLIEKIKVGSTINSLDFTADDSKLVVGGNNQRPDTNTGRTVYTGFVTMIDVPNRQILWENTEARASVKSVRISPDQRWVASGGFDHSARLHDFQTGVVKKAFEEPLRIEAVAFTPDGQYLLAGGHQPLINFYRLSDFALAYQLPSPRTEYIDISRDGRLLLTGHEDSGLLSLHLFVSNTQHQTGLYHRLSNRQLNNRDLQRP